MMNKQDHFLQVALSLIHTKGYKATTMRDLAVALDCEVANIYNYINSKQALLVDNLFETSDKFHTGIKHIIQSSYPPKDKLRQLISLHIKITSEAPYQAALLVNEWRNLEEPNKTNFLKAKAQYTKMVGTLLKEGMKEGAIRTMPIPLATEIVLSSVRWLYSWYINHSKSVNPIELEKQIMEFVSEGIASK